MHTFPKSEKLCGQLRIAALYKGSKRFVAFPMRVNYMCIRESAQPPRVLIWAPKSLFKHAVDRNHMRRLMREAYRLSKQPLTGYWSEQNCSMQIAFNYMDKGQRSQADITGAMQIAVQKILKQLQE